VESRALIAYDESNLYVGLIAYDNHDEIRASLRERDNIFRDDYFGLMLDTYGDQSWGYEIFVNPFGVQGDLRMLSSGNEEISFDIVFESVGIVTDSGYQVEIVIPFASLRFPNKPVQTWRVNFWRDRQRENRNKYAWAAQDRDEPCFMCQWGYLTGIEDIKPSSNIEILPNILGFQSGSLTDGSDPGSGFDNSDPDAELSLNVRYGITSNSSAEITFNPDFSQVESDAGQIDVNTTFGLFFPERRPFFQEGSNLFNTWINAIHTRSINDPEVAGKFTGQFGHTSMAYLLARDENSTLLLPFSERSIGTQVEKSTVNVFRIRHTLGNDSHLGALVTDRRLSKFSVDGNDGSTGSGSAYGIDGTIRFLKNYRIEFQALGSHTEEPDAPDLIDTTVENGMGQQFFDKGRHTVALDGESFSGHAIYAGFERSARMWNLDLEYWEYSPTFRTDNGFTTQNDYRLVSLWTGVVFRPNREWLVNWEPSIELGRKWDHSRYIDLDPTTFNGGTKDEWIRPHLWFRLKGQTDVNITHINSRERFGDRLHEGISRLSMRVDSRFSEMLSGGVSYTFGRTIWRSRTDPTLGKMNDVYTYVNIKPTERLFIQPSLNFSRLEHRDGYLEANPDEEKVIFSGYIFRSRLTYQFTREWYLRLIVQYNDFSERLDLEPLLTYKINPFTVFYVGVNSRYKYFDVDSNSSLTNSEWELSSRQFFAKLQYLFRV